MPSTILKVGYAYVEIPNKSGELARILDALREANVNLLAFSGFPQGRAKAQLDLFTDDLDGLMHAAGRVATGRRRFGMSVGISRQTLVHISFDEAQTLGRSRIVEMQHGPQIRSALFPNDAMPEFRAGQ